MRKNRAIRLIGALAAATAGLLASNTLGQATCNFSQLCPDSMWASAPTYSNIGCDPGMFVGRCKGGGDLVGDGNGTLTQVRYGIGIYLINWATGVELASTGENDLQLPCSYDSYSIDFEAAQAQVGTPNCVCVPTSSYATHIVLLYDYDPNTNSFDGEEDMLSTTSSP